MYAVQILSGIHHARADYRVSEREHGAVIERVFSRDHAERVVEELTASGAVAQVVAL